jgi:hypothetical protein
MRLGTVLATEPTRRYQPIGVHGQPVFESHIQLKAALTQRFGPGYADSFSKPDQDARDETIRWVAEIPGEARSWRDLTPEEQTRTALALEAMHADIKSYAAEIRATSKDTSALSFAALLDNALSIPAIDHVHLVGETPVLSFWGFQGVQASTLVHLQPPPPAAAVMAPAAVAPAVATPWWKHLLWLLPLLLLLALLLAWLFLGQGCTDPKVTLPTVPPVADPEKPLEEKPLEEKSGVPVVPGTGGIAVPDGNGTIPPASGTLPVAPDTPRAPATDSPPPPTTPPTVPPPPRPDAPPGDAMQIPPDAAQKGDVTFLDGLWRSRRGLIDNSTGEELTQYYRFGQNGTGETVVRRSDGTECKAPARGAFKNGQLVLEEEGNLVCPDGRTYDRSQTQCDRTASGVTTCYGVNPDGSRYRVGLEKPKDPAP